MQHYAPSFKELSRKLGIISKLRDEERSNFADSPDVEHGDQYTSPLSRSTTCAREKREIKVDFAKVSRKTDE